MDNQEEYPNLSRAELIKLARDSCSKNLGPVNRNSKEYGLAKQKEQHYYDGRAYDLSGKLSEIPPVSIKFFLIRVICALMIFLTVLLIDKLDINFGSVNSDYIRKCVSSNQEIEDAERIVVSFFEDFVKADE